jgi:glycosyltransferase involved in cell wall biosynthesis
MGEPSGGTDRVSALSSGLAARGVDVTLVIPAPSGAVPARLNDVALEHVDGSIPGSIARAFAVMERARTVARERDAVLQVEHSSLAGIGTLRDRKGFVLDMHDLAYSRFDHVDTRLAFAAKRAVEWLETRAVNRADRIVVVSERMGEMLRDRWDVPGEKVTVVPNGYFPETVRAATDTPTVPGRVAFFGTLHPKVDVRTLVAVARLPEVTDLVVIGDGAQRERVEQAARSVDALRPTGRLPDREAFSLLASASVAINPQVVSAIQRSSSPVKLFYYAALGRPMVVTPGPSIVDDLMRRSAAMTACSKDKFAERVRLALTDKRLAADLATNAAATAREFTWSERVGTFSQLYQADEPTTNTTRRTPTS